MFASRTFLEHAARGVLGIALILTAVWIGQKPGSLEIVTSLALGAAALAAFRGCPVCWTMGLVEMIAGRRRA